MPSLFLNSKKGNINMKLEKQYFEDESEEETYIMVNGKLVKVEVNDEDESEND